MYTPKSIARRGSMLGAALAVVVASAIPAATAFADALNPLTERSLLLSSSAPGWQDTDGSNYSTGSSNPASISDPLVPGSYAPAGSGPNGKKTGETFTFRVSSADTVKGFSLQYCTEAAGKCRAPGNNAGNHLDADRETNLVGHANKTSDLEFVGAWGEGSGAGQVEVSRNGTPMTGWTVDADNLESQDYDFSGANAGKGLTGKDNYVNLMNDSNTTAFAAGDQITVKFTPSETTYITNPGDDAFFVKINTYSTGVKNDMIGGHNDTTPLVDDDHTVIDGGVTVANVMTDSIHITTKVLETMAFSVGVQNPDSQNLPSHGICDNIDVINNNRLNLGNVNAENSLETSTAYDTHSYWRLSSNSSGGATVYYSGNTLANTVGDEIADMTTKTASHPGTEQFGLAVVPLDTAGVDADGTGTFDPARQAPTISPLVVGGDYNEGVGTINTALPADWVNNAKFTFKKTSNTVPEVIAQNTDGVLNCATAKMRYVANIAANTPAGVYTTKINYLAAPQY